MQRRLTRSFLRYAIYSTILSSSFEKLANLSFQIYIYNSIQHIHWIALIFRALQQLSKNYRVRGFSKTDALIFTLNLLNFGFLAVRMMDIRICQF